MYSWFARYGWPASLGIVVVIDGPFCLELIKCVVVFLYI